MSDDQPIAFPRPGVRPAGRAEFTGPGGLVPQVSFDRRELDLILSLYGRMVAAGEWRDYALDFLRDAAIFSVFRRTAEMPLYRIEKRPKLRRAQGQYAVTAAGGLVLKRGHELKPVLAVLERKLLKAVGD